MLKTTSNERLRLNEQDRHIRRRFLWAMLTTCVVLAMVAGSFHVVQLGANRMQSMRNKASYDLKEMDSHIRAAGEELYLQAQHRSQISSQSGYTVVEAQALLTQSQWVDVETQQLIPAGEFFMGTNSEKADLQDQPERKIFVAAYKIDKYPVTNAQYARFVADSGHRVPLHWTTGKIPTGLEMHPVTMVSWFDANAYARWAGKRLVKEAEWEKAARGERGLRWPWGNTMEPHRLNTYYNVGSTTEVNHYTSGASPYGVMDMAGNVSEWTADDFLPYAGSKAPLILFKGKIAKANTTLDRAMKVVDLEAVDANYKVMRGGSWKGDPFSTSAYHRNYSWPHYAADFYGFRCAQDVKK